MSEILRRLHREVFVLSVDGPLIEAPELQGFVTRLRDDGELEVEKGPETDMNDLFAELQGCGIRVASLRNKANRLEEMFMQLVESKGDAT
jgi:ABC-2 type transport system ATP-binding protein